LELVRRDSSTDIVLFEGSGLTDLSHALGDGGGGRRASGSWPRPDQSILVVEDDATIRFIVRIFLERMGHVLLEACDGADGDNRFAKLQWLHRPGRKRPEDAKNARSGFRRP
jgi:hypothetical protein